MALGRERCSVVIRRSTALLVGLFLVAGFGMQTGAQQALQLPTVVTVGLGYVVVPADHVVVTLNIESSSSSAEEAYAQSAHIAQEIRRELEEAELKGLAISIGRTNL